MLNSRRYMLSATIGALFRHCFAQDRALRSVHADAEPLPTSSGPAATLSEGEKSQGGTVRRRGPKQKSVRGAAIFPNPGLARGYLALTTLVVFIAGAVLTRELLPAITGPLPLEPAEAVSVTVVDGEERLLRAFTTVDGRWRLPVETAEVDPRYLTLLMAYEDRRFYSHWGVDPFAIVRSMTQFVTRLRIISGASTLTMQVARLLEGEHERTGFGKLRQMTRALRLERRLSKEQVLRLYLRLAPFGGNVEGVRAASLAYFGKEPRRLSIGEAALLVALPQSPEARRPDRHSAAARRARDQVIGRAVAAGVLKPDDGEAAKREPVPNARREFPKLAPHLSEAEIKRVPERVVHRLTLDGVMQEQLEALAREHAIALGPKLSVALMAVEHKTGRIIAHVGSAGFLDESRQGANDMTEAVRSPGSTLKPLIYGLGFEYGLAHPETLIEDRPARFGLYAPKNFDEDFRGTVSIREALAHSLNIPAVKVLAAVGPSRLVGRLRRSGIIGQLPPGTEPSLAIALGGVGLRLRDLTMLYASMARGGEAVELVHSRDDAAVGAAAVAKQRLLSAAAAWQIGDILKDAPAPANARGGRIAYKTGTSYGFRDAWAAGFDGRVTIVVWVGRADGTPTPALTGRSAAAPVLFDAFQRIGRPVMPLAGPPHGVLRAAGSALPPPLRRFKEPGEEPAADGAFIETPVAIAFPPDRADLETGTSGEGIVLKADGGALPLTWLVDGVPLDVEPDRREVIWQPGGRGFAKISVIDAKGRADRVEVRVK